MAEPALDFIVGDKKEPKPADPPPTRDDAAASLKAQAEEEERRRVLVAKGASGNIFGGMSLSTSEAGGVRTLGGS